MMKRFILVTAFFAGAIYSCQKSLTNSLIENVREACEQSKKNTIDLREVTKFKWDDMYIFPDWTTADSIQSTIKTAYNGEDVPDDYRRIIFTRQNQIVFQEDIKSFSQGNFSVEFEGLAEKSMRNEVYHLDAKNSTFAVRKIKGDEICKNCTVYFLSKSTER